MINRNSVAAPDKTPRPPKLHLPFETKKTDAGEWAYDHRVGLCITLIAYLVLAIALWWEKSSWGPNLPCKA